MDDLKAVSRSRWPVAVGVLVGVALAAGAFVAYDLTHGAAVADTSATAATNPAQALSGQLVVAASRQAQKASGIETAPISSERVSPTTDVYADVIDLQPLFDLSNKWASDNADLDTAQAQVDVAKAKYDRNSVLYGGKSTVSEQTLQDSHATLLSDQAKLQASQAALSGIAAMLRQQFGDALAQDATGGQSDVIQRLAAGRASVVRVSLPSNIAAPETLSLDEADQRAVPATKLSPSPQNDPVIQGRPFLYLADDALPAGQRLMARIVRSDHKAGLLIPLDAVVWYGGQRWVYVRDKPGSFIRRPIPQGAFQTDKGLIVTGGFKAGEAIVVRGAQLLLSQELRPQNITTACKDPPECDD